MAPNRNFVLVLLVEDDEERANRIKYLLRHEQVRIVHARLGEQAVGCIREKFDLILLDHDLPGERPLGSSGIDGRGVVAKIVASAVNRSTPIIIHSMNPAGRNEMARALVSNGYLVEIRPFAEWDDGYTKALLEELLCSFDRNLS